MLEILVPLANLLPHGKALRFHFERQGKPFEGFVLRHQESLYAYLNQCPHWYVDLDMGFGDFYDPADDRIFCRTHGALFQPDNGLCDSGPCTGYRLERFDLRVEGDDAWVSVPS